MPWWWTLQHPIRYLYSRAQSAIVFDSTKCINCTTSAMTEFSIDYDEKLAYFGKEQKWVGVIGSLRIDDEKNVTLDIPREIPWQYRDYKSVYNRQYSDEIPPHRSFDHAIDMIEGKEPTWGPIYTLSEKELQVLWKYLDIMLKRGKIRPSKSPAGVPILFVPKDHGHGLRLCVDYRGLNKVMILNRYLQPVMNEFRDGVRGTRIFTKLDLKAGYNLIRIKKGDKSKTGFRAGDGHYEHADMPFGLANAPATFQNMMNEIFKDMIDHGVVIYLDDILIYSRREEDHIALTKKVLERQQEH